MWANTGATMIIGWERWAVADFEDDRPRDVVHDLMAERARDQGWAVDEVAANEYGNWIYASSWLTHARVRLGAQLEAGERIDSSAGTVVVSHNEELRHVLFWGFVLAGGIGGGAVGRWSNGQEDSQASSKDAASAGPAGRATDNAR